MILKGLSWVESVRMVDSQQTPLEELLRFSDELLVYFPQAQTEPEVFLFRLHIIISELPQDERALVVLSPFDSIKTIRVGVLSALVGQPYRSPRLRQNGQAEAARLV